MERVADGVWHIRLPPLGGVNAYVAGDVLVDAGYPFTAKRLLGEIDGVDLRAHVLTHGHVDHAGGSARVCEERRLPLWCPSGDVDAVLRGYAVPPPHLRAAGMPLSRVNGWKGVAADRALREGDEVGGFEVLGVPGHSPGHIALWRESDRVLIAGDVFFNLNLVTLRPGLRQPPWIFTADPDRNRESMRRLADLEPAIACFGHGPVLNDAAPKLRRFVDSL